MDLSNITEGWHDLPIAGKTYAVRLLRLAEWGKLQGWLKQAVPSPVEEAIRSLDAFKARGEKIDPETRQAVLDHAHDAARLWPPRVGSLAWIEALNAVEGGTARFLRDALRAAGHEVSDDLANEVEAKADVGQIADLIRVCLHGEGPGPKAMTAPKEAGPRAKIIRSKRTTGESCSSGSSKRPDGRTNPSAGSLSPSS